MRRLRILLALAFLPLAAACSAESGGGTDVAEPLDTPTLVSQETPSSQGTPLAPGSGGLYLALGDSLSFGIGATDPAATGFVPLVHEALGEGVELLNLGVPGHTSQDLIDGPLGEATAEIAFRNGDDEEANDVRLVTLEIGGNDLLRLYFSQVQTGACPNVTAVLANAVCADALRGALDGFTPNFRQALGALRAADAALPIIVLTLYNPFEELGAVGDLGDLSLEGREDTPFEEGLNDLIRQIAAEYEGVTVVDVFPLFRGRSLSLIAADFIHPNDAGYRLMADAVLEALP
jgi:lysophospholipase L1-like esterase